MFGKIINDKIVLNEAGSRDKVWFYELENKFRNIQCGKFVCMPNHVHFIIIISPSVGADLCVCPSDTKECVDKKSKHSGSSLPKIIQWFKTMTTNEYICNVKINQWPPFQKKLWQRNYYEHVIRNEKAMNEICEYIKNNPMKWEHDDYNPKKKP